MTFRFSDRVKVTTTAPGTAAIPAAPTVVTGFIGFASIPSIANSDVVPYEITDGAAAWESGIGTWNSVTGLTRTTIYANSAGTFVAINFTNPVTVTCCAIAATLPLLDASGNLGIGTTNPLVGSLSNTKRISAGIFQTVNGSTGGYSLNTWVTAFTFTQSGIYMVGYNGIGAEGYGGVALVNVESGAVVCGGGGGGVSNCRGSGLNFQMQQTASGGTLTYNWYVLRIG